MAFRLSIHLLVALVVGVTGLVLLVYGSCTLPDKSVTITTGPGIDFAKAQEIAEAEKQAAIIASSSF